MNNRIFKLKLINDNLKNIRTSLMNDGYFDADVLDYAAFDIQKFIDDHNR